MQASPEGIRRGRQGRWKGLVIASCVALAGGLSVPSAWAADGVDVVVRVRVTDAGGAPIARAQVLTTVHWTSKADFERHGNQRGRMLRADSNGELVVPIRLDRAQRAAVRRNGDWANITAVAFDAGGSPIGMATTSRYIGLQAGKRTQARSMPHADILRLVARGRVSSSTDGLSAAADITPCTYYWDADSYANRYAQVGELHVDYDVPYARFTYGATADSTFDVATRAGVGDWSISGGVHVENTLDSAVYANAGGMTNYHWALRTQFRFVSVKLFKDCLGGPYRAWTGSQYVTALEWTGNGMTLPNTLTQPTRVASYSATYGRYTGWSRSTGTLVKWYGTVTPFGASLGAQSGASTNVKIEYEFGGRSTHYLYGDSGLPSISKRVFQDTP